MFTPAKRRWAVKLESPASLPQGGFLLPFIPFQAGTHPWVQREPHSMACGNTASRYARHKQRKGGCSGPRRPVLYPTGLPPKPAARCVSPLAWAAGAGRGPELPLRSGKKGKGRSGSSAATISSPSNSMGFTSTTQGPQILAGIGPTL